MKLLKQNDSAGGLIFKQNVNGKAMKQNYNFGNLSSITSRSIYIEIPSLIGEDASGWTINFFSKGPAGTFGYFPRFLIRNSENTSYVRVNDQFRIIDVAFKSSDWNQDFVFPSDYNLMNNNKSKGFISFHQEPSVRSCIVSKIYLHKSNQTGPGESNIAYFTIFDRIMSSTEVSYLFNNMLGNDPLSTFGMICRLEFNNIQISGGDIIVTDLSGNENHGVYRGLPAGTLEDQLAFVQSNLIKPW